MTKECLDSTCTSQIHARGLCTKHYQQLRKMGFPEGVAVPNKPATPQCGLELCIEPQAAKGYCRYHYDHQSGKVRGILCSNCNTALGLLAESEERFLALMQYMAARKSQEVFN